MNRHNKLMVAFPVTEYLEYIPVYVRISRAHSSLWKNKGWLQM